MHVGARLAIFSVVLRRSPEASFTLGIVSKALADGLVYGIYLFEDIEALSGAFGFLSYVMSASMVASVGCVDSRDCWASARVHTTSAGSVYIVVRF
jgi:hypothetical protein